MAEKILLNAVLGFACQWHAPRVLLARKTRHIGAGCWNGYCGGIDGKESRKKAMARELKEESGLTVEDPNDLHERAVVDFHNITKEGEPFTCRVFVFLFWNWTGQPRSTEEMEDPTWFSWRELPLNEMMPADPFWLPRLLKGDCFYAEVWYGPGQKTLRRQVEIHWRSDCDE